MHIHGPTLLQTERHDYLKSTFLVLSWVWKLARSHRGRQEVCRERSLPFWALRAINFFTCRVCWVTDIKSKGTGEGCSMWGFCHVPVVGHFMWEKDLRVERAIINGDQNSTEFKSASIYKVTWGYLEHLKYQMQFLLICTDAINIWHLTPPCLHT